MQRIGIIVLAALILLVPVVTAQDNPPSERGPIILVTGADTTGDGFPIAIVDVGTGQATTLATFGRRAACAPSIFPDGRTLVYEISGEPKTVYALNTATSERTIFHEQSELSLDCPVVAPDGSAIAWIQPDGNSAKLTITDTLGRNPRELVAHQRIFDVQWSPAASLLIYTVTTNNVPYPELYSIPRSGAVAPFRFWSREMGLVLDYEWTRNRQGLLVAYTVDSGVGITRLTSECIIGLELCQIDPIARFPGEARIDLLDAYSPISEEVVISVQFPDPTVGFPKADLWLLDLSRKNEPRQITNSPALLKTGAMWSRDGREIFFIGSTFDEVRDQLRGGIYSIPYNATEPPEIRFESDIFSPASLLWQFND